MRLLLTRPAANAVPLAEKLAQLGHDVLISPIIEIFPTETPLPALPQAPASRRIGGLAFTSANGVYALAARFSTEKIKADWQALPAYAVGPQTAAVLATLGWPQIHEAAGDVESLAATLLAAHDNAAGPILHLAGSHRAGNLAKALAAGGLDCQLAVLYEAEPAAQLSAAARAALQDKEQPIEAVLIYSQRTAKHFLALTAGLNMVEKPIAFCLSPAIATLMQAAGYETACAAQADEAAMLALCGRAAAR